MLVQIILLDLIQGCTTPAKLDASQRVSCPTVVSGHSGGKLDHPCLIGSDVREAGWIERVVADLPISDSLSDGAKKRLVSNGAFRAIIIVIGEDPQNGEDSKPPQPSALLSLATSGSIGQLRT